MMLLHLLRSAEQTARCKRCLESLDKKRIGAWLSGCYWTTELTVLMKSASVDEFARYYTERSACYFD